MHTESCTPFSFIINQLTAAEQERTLENIEPPKRQRGRPAKPVEEPIAPNAHRHHLSDADPECCKLGKDDRRKIRLEYADLMRTGMTTPNAIRKLLRRYEVTYKEAFDICRAA
jgi:hypothetical protein